MEKFKFEDVQKAMGGGFTQEKDPKKPQFMNQDLIMKIFQNPKLAAAFQDPETSQILQELSVDAERTQQRYKNHPKFAEVVSEFSKLLRSHIIDNKDTIDAQNAEEAKKLKQMEEAKKMADSMPPEVKAIFEDQKVIKVIEQMRRDGNMEFYELAKRDPETARKIQFLISRGLIGTTSVRPDQVKK